MRRILVAVAAFAVSAAVVLLYPRTRPAPDLPPNVSRHEYDVAAGEFSRRYQRQPDRMDVLSWLGEAALQDGREKAALACFQEIPESHNLYGHYARYLQGRAHFELSEAAAAERQFRTFLRLEEQSPHTTMDDVLDAMDHLRHLLEVQLRFEERRALLAAMYERGECDALDTVKLCFPSLLRWHGPQTIQWLEEFHRADPRNLRLRTALGRYRMAEGRLDEAREILEACLREAPTDRAAAAALAEHYREQDDWDSILRVLNPLPERAPDDPWLLLQIRGQLALHVRRYDEAVDCFEQLSAADPANAAAQVGLGEAWGGLGQVEKREAALRKANVLARVQNRLGWGQEEAGKIEPYVEIGDLCLEIELLEEARAMAWCIDTIESGHPAAARLRSIVDFRRSAQAPSQRR